jgi:hypothetical protein
MEIQGHLGNRTALLLPIFKRSNIFLLRRLEKVSEHLAKETRKQDIAAAAAAAAAAPPLN